MKARQGYLLGLGCNLRPEQNMVEIISLLLDKFERFDLSRVLHIPPVGMNTHHDFLNAVAFIETDLDQQTLKAHCNAIEAALGRDRDDPSSKTKDRTADLDILTPFRLPDDLSMPMSTITDEYFLYPLLEELFAFLAQQSLPAMQSGETLQLGGLTFGQTATTIHRDANSGQERIS